MWARGGGGAPPPPGEKIRNTKRIGRGADVLGVLVIDGVGEAEAVEVDVEVFEEDGVKEGVAVELADGVGVGVGATEGRR